MSTRKLAISLSLSLSLFLSLSLPHTAQAQPVDLTSTFPVGPFSSIGHLFSVILSNAYIFAGVIFLFMLVITGLSYIFGAGVENPQKIQQVQQMLLWSLVGFMVIIASYWIVQAIEVLTGVNIL